jgi:cytosine/adenosine deaminase-related metal-dependent hydrolase
MRNAAGIPPLMEMFASGVHVALGTDNVSNNNSYDMFKEMTLTGKVMALLKRDPAAIPTRSWRWLLWAVHAHLERKKKSVRWKSAKRPI